MFKQLCLLTRRPGMSMEHFKEYYETKHAPLLASMMPRARRYVRRFVEPEFNPVSQSSPHIPFDCLMELWWDSRADFEETMAQLGKGNAFQLIHEDEEKIFASHDNPVFSVVEAESRMLGYADEPALDGPRRADGDGHMLKLVFLLKRRPGMSVPEFREYYETRHRVLGETAMTKARRYVRRFVEPEPNPITGEAIELPFDAVMEIWWDSREDWDEMKRLMGESDLGREIYEDEDNIFASHANPVFTVEEVDSPMRGW